MSEGKTWIKSNRQFSGWKPALPVTNIGTRTCNPLGPNQKSGLCKSNLRICNPLCLNFDRKSLRPTPVCNMYHVQVSFPVSVRKKYVKMDKLPPKLGCVFQFGISESAVRALSPSSIYIYMCVCVFKKPCDIPLYWLANKGSL